MDFNIWNLLQMEDSIGIIDAEESFYGHAELDIARSVSRWTVKYQTTESFLKGYRKISDLEKGWGKRLNFYYLYNQLFTSVNTRNLGWTSLEKTANERIDKFLKQEKIFQETQ